MEVTFLRHGIAVDRTDPLCPVDFDRPLTVEGKNKLDAALRGLKALGVRPDLVFTSPYVRCVQTATLAARALDVPRRAIHERQSLVPGADPRGFWDEALVNPRERLLVVGHGDTLEPIAGRALGFPFVDAASALPTSPLALRVLHLKKGGALQLVVPPDATPAQLGLERHATLAWLLSARLLRQLGRG
ncbi:MAG: histidine phosphatase family protein [Deltaproteobacteria bacterium]|nr:histidine phosphatase family protein [Deltaproteobacteria bacterium]